MDDNCSQSEMVGSLGRHVAFRNRLRKTLYYGKYSDASLPSLLVTDVAVETLNTAVPSAKRILDKKQAMAVSRRARVSPCTLMVGMLYTERLGQQNPSYLSKVSSSDLFLISIMMASKYLYDEGEEEEVFNDDWARAGRKCTKDVNSLEMEFLASIDWNLFVSANEFLSFVNKVETRVAVGRGLARGWFTYTDMCTLLDNMTFYQTLNTLKDETLRALCLCTATYMVAVSIAIGCAVLMPSVLQLTAFSSPCLSVKPFLLFSSETSPAFKDSSHQPRSPNMAVALGRKTYEGLDYTTAANQTAQINPESFTQGPCVNPMRNTSSYTRISTSHDCQNSGKNCPLEKIPLLDKAFYTLLWSLPHFIHEHGKESHKVNFLSGATLMPALVQNSSVCFKSSIWSL